MVDLPAPIGRLPYRHAHLAQLALRFSKQFHQIFPRLSRRQFHRESPYRISCFADEFLLCVYYPLLFGVIIFLSCQNNSPSSNSPSPTGSKDSPLSPSAISLSKMCRITSSNTLSVPRLSKNISSFPRAITLAISFSKTISSSA